MSPGGEKKDVLQLGKGGIETPDPLASFFSCYLNKISSVSEPSVEALVAAI